MSSFKLRGMNRDSQEEAVQLREDDLGVQEPVRGQWTMLSTLLWKYRLQRRLGNLPRNRNFWVLWLLPHNEGEVPKI